MKKNKIKQPTKEQLIEMFFKKPNWFGTRKCPILPYKFLDKRNKLIKQESNYAGCFWYESNWKEFHKDLESYYKEIKNNCVDSSVENFDWSFIYTNIIEVEMK